MRDGATGAREKRNSGRSPRARHKEIIDCRRTVVETRIAYTTDEYERDRSIGAVVSVSLSPQSLSQARRWKRIMSSGVMASLSPVTPLALRPGASPRVYGGVPMKYAMLQRSRRTSRACAGRSGMRRAIQAVAAPGNFTAWDTAVQRVPKRTDIKTIMLLGAGPIVIGQVRGSSFLALVII